MQKSIPGLSRCAVLFAVALSMAGCNSGGNTSTSTSTPPAVSAPVTWFIPEGTSLDTTQSNLLESGQLYFNVQSANNTAGEIRGGITPSSSVYQTDGGDPFAANPANTPVTFAAILGGDQVRPRNVETNANGYGSVTFDPLTKQLSGFIVTFEISGTGAQIQDGLPGISGATVITLEGGPVVWTIPPATVLSDSLAARLSAGAFYATVSSGAFPGGEIRGQLDQQVRSAALKGSSEVPPVTTSASGVGFLALKQSTRQFSGFVKVQGLSSAIRTVVLHIGAAGTNGIAISGLVNRGGGIWTFPVNTILGDAQVTSFNNDELYFNIHTNANLTGELRGQILKSGVIIGTADLSGSKAVPPVSTQASGTGIVAFNPVTEQVSGSLITDKVLGTLSQIHSGTATTAGLPLITLATTSPVTVAPTPGISFALDVQPIFNANCAVSICHVTGGIAPMSLQPGLAYANTIGLVIPGNSASSYFVSRLTGAFPPRMPLNRLPLNATDLDRIKAWIDNGALDN